MFRSKEIVRYLSRKLEKPADRLACLLIVLYFLFQLLFGALYHPIEATHTAEDDGYMLMALSILDGQLPRDVYHPLLYPILIAITSFITGDAFVAARTISTLSTLILLLLSYLLCRKCFSSEIGIFVIVAELLNISVLTEGVYAAADMTFAALALTTLFGCVCVVQDPQRKHIVFIALAFAAAFFLKNQAISLIPIILLAIYSAHRVGLRLKFFHMIQFFLCGALFLIPHFYLTTLIFHNPIYNENWRNFAFKLYGQGDWSYYNRMPYHGWLSIIRDCSPELLLSSTMKMLKYFFTDTYPILMGNGLIGLVLSIISILGMMIAVGRLTRPRFIILSLFIIQVLFVCILFGPTPRLLLVLIPIGYVFSGVVLFASPLNGLSFYKRFRLKYFLSAFLLFPLALNAPPQIAWFINNHPYQELKDTLEIEHIYGKEIVVYGTSPSFKRLLRCAYRTLPEPTPDEAVNPGLYYAKIETILSLNNADYVVIGKTSLLNRPTDLLLGNHPPSFLKLLKKDDGASVYRCVKKLTANPTRDAKPEEVIHGPR